MKLYYFPHTDNNRKVLAVIHHLALDVERVEIDLLKGEHLTPEFLALNPNHMTPVLQDGEFVLWESNAIMQYLCSLRPGTALWPVAPKIQADIARWQFWQTAHWGQCCGIVMFQRLIMPRIGKTPNEALIERELKNFATHAEVLNRHLQGRTWLVGEGVTLADLAVAAPLATAETVGLPLEPYPSIRRWYAQLDDWDGWQASAPPAWQ